ncbi:hypothetical protein [Labrys monachus]|jgi:hypothetical protein|uniref:Small lipoprotein YifL n=1 Tax=Labrys monachus TaxID=217067 RepID=A0ABU0F7S0_9HYPH|nr:hypothetical protein [Labrys monachus]MDQ0390656.1 putative small lipoprotein YifL [Labrys monachus]
MKLIKTIAAVLALASLAACVHTGDYPDHRPTYITAPDSGWHL